jgi:hypothetical protein
MSAPSPAAGAAHTDIPTDVAFLAINRAHATADLLMTPNRPANTPCASARGTLCQIQDQSTIMSSSQQMGRSSESRLKRNSP